MKKLISTLLVACATLTGVSVSAKESTQESVLTNTEKFVVSENKTLLSEEKIENDGCTTTISHFAIYIEYSDGSWMYYEETSITTVCN